MWGKVETMLKTIHKWRIIKVMLLFISILYIWFMYIDIYNTKSFISSDGLKFLSMILVFVISLITRDDALSFKDLHLLQIGLLITIYADFFLLILNSHYILGIGLFSIVQILYSIRYKSDDIKMTINKFLTIFFSLSFLYIIINFFLIKIKFLLIIGLHYSFCLLTSVKRGIDTYRYKKFPKLNSQMIALGMILFLLCDINVGLYNILGFIAFRNKTLNIIYNISSISMWLFYMPSQVLLSLSGYKYNINRK